MIYKGFHYRSFPTGWKMALIRSYQLFKNLFELAAGKGDGF